MASPQVHAFFDPETWTLTYVVSDPATRDAVIIDPVLHYDVLSSQTSTKAVAGVVATIEAEGLVVRGILETHAHADHLSAAQYLAARYHAPVGIGRGIDVVQRTFSRIFNLKPATVDGSQFDILMDDHELRSFGSLVVQALRTPGHTPACVSYLIGDAVFTGDALFLEDYGTGRTDFPAGSAKDLYHSVHEVLYGLPGETRVFVGHDYQPGGREVRFESTIAREREHNVQLREQTTESEFVTFRQQRDAKLQPPRLIYPSIQVNIFAGKLPEPEDNGLRYLKIPLNHRVPTDEAGNPRQEPAHAAKSAMASCTDIDVADLDALPQGTRLIDVREPHEFDGELGHLEGAELFPMGSFPHAALSWDRERPLLVICRSGNRSSLVARTLAAIGFRHVMNLSGGMLMVRGRGAA